MFAERFITKPEIVAGPDKARIQLKSFLKTRDGRWILQGIVVQARDPVTVERLLRISCRKLFQLGSRPVAALEQHIRHCESKPAALIEGRQGFRLFHRYGAIQILPVEKEDAPEQGQ